MTEAEWMASADPAAMLAYVQDKASPRQLRLFACACCRQAWDGAPCGRCEGRGYAVIRRTEIGPARREMACPDCRGTGRTGGLTDPRSRRAVEVAERYADGEATDREMWGAQAAASAAVAERAAYAPGIGHPDLLAAHVAIPGTVELGTYFERQEGPPAAAVQAALLRCVIGNPWRPVELPGPPCPDCAPGEPDENCDDCGGDGTVDGPCPWFTPAVVQVARSIYDERRFADLGILADALEDAGCPAHVTCPECEDESGYRVHCGYCEGSGRAGRILNPLIAHLRQVDVVCPQCGGKARGVPARGGGWTTCPVCRGRLRVPAPHALPGCHVVDLILGKE